MRDLLEQRAHARGRRAGAGGGMTPLGVAAGDGVRRARGALPPRRARAPPAGAGVLAACRSRCRSRSGCASRGQPELRVWLRLERERALEEDEVGVELVVASERPVERLELAARAPGRARGRFRRRAPSRAPRLGRRADDRAAPPLRALGELRGRRHPAARARPARSARLGAASSTGRLCSASTRCPRRCAGSSRRVATQPFAGNEVARQKGEGLEFADLRDFAPGDRVRSINWRASAAARRSELVVNERSPERNADVILFLDTFADARAGGRSTLELAVRATSTLASHYLERRDRVGLVSFGGDPPLADSGDGAQRSATGSSTRCSSPRSSSTTRGRTSRSSRPGRCPPQALVLAVTPLLDDRAVEALVDLRARGYDLAIVEVSPVPLRRARRERGRTRSRTGSGCCGGGSCARATSVSASPWRRWSDEPPLDAALEGVRAFRRHARLARV